MNVVCYLCSRKIEPTDKVLHRVVGWEEKRRSGGANQIIKRRVTNHVAHADCVRYGPSTQLIPDE